MDKTVVIGGETSLDFKIDGDLSLSLLEDGVAGTVISYEPHAREPYTGAYTVEPDWNPQILQTKEKVMTDNVTVEGIYITSVTNLSGGNTVYIGGVINE